MTRIAHTDFPLRSFTTFAFLAIALGFGFTLCTSVTSVVKRFWLWLYHAVTSVVRCFLDAPLIRAHSRAFVAKWSLIRVHQRDSAAGVYFLIFSVSPCLRGGFWFCAGASK